MATLFRSAALLALAVMLVPAFPALAQDKMAEGTWTGMVMPPDDDMVDVEYVVAYGEDGLEIEIVPPPEAGMGGIPAGEVMHDGDTLTFTLEVGISVVCTLLLEDDGHYEGECVDPSGEGAIMTMWPPEA